MHGNHLVNHIHNPHLIHDNDLHVIRVISNPARFQSRYRLAREQVERLENTPCVKLYTVECAFGDRQHEVTEAGNPRHLQLRTNSEIWIKENMINLGVRNLIPRTAKYIAWIDGDITFDDDTWAQETLHQLQHFEVVQPWTQCVDLGPMGNIMQMFGAFGFAHQRRVKKNKWQGDYGEYAHSGFAWACTRRFWEAVGGLVDFCIHGSADHHMAFAMIDEVESTIHRGMGFDFHNKLREWEERAVRVTKREVGFVKGFIKHHFHGKKRDRKYRERWQVLIDHKYDPSKDLMYDDAGVIQLTGKSSLEQDIHFYNRQRSEDSVDEY